jgi:hypothetical protein
MFQYPIPGLATASGGRTAGGVPWMVPALGTGKRKGGPKAAFLRLTTNWLLSLQAPRFTSGTTLSCPTGLVQ